MKQHIQSVTQKSNKEPLSQNTKILTYYKLKHKKEDLEKNMQLL